MAEPAGRGVPLLIGIAAAAIPFFTRGEQWFLGGCLVAITAIIMTFWDPGRWLLLFFVVDFLTPPLGGNTEGAGFHLAMAAATLGLAAGLPQWNEWRMRRGALLFLLATFAACLFASLPFALLYSGVERATGSALRIGLFLIGGYVFCYALCAPSRSSGERGKLALWLFFVAAASAAFACLDFYFQFPAPSGFSQQYVWLDSGVFRRAQGFFYDASTLGNFCAFFLLYGLLELLERGRHRGWILKWAGVIVLACALVLSYSRASLVNLAVALIAYAVVRGGRAFRTSAAVLLAAAVAMILVQAILPSFATGYFGRILGSFQYFAERPDSVLSGRLTSWNTIAGIIAEHPWEAIFGIGYKTLPYTTHFGDPLVADNTYLSLLLETGIAGLASFMLLLGAILNSTFHAARAPSPEASLLGKWAFCFWCGQAVQMLSGDLLTYWRVLPIYFWATAAALREEDNSNEDSFS